MKSRTKIATAAASTVLLLGIVVMLSYHSPTAKPGTKIEITQGPTSGADVERTFSIKGNYAALQSGSEIRLKVDNDPSKFLSGSASTHADGSFTIEVDLTRHYVQHLAAAETSQSNQYPLPAGRHTFQIQVVQPDAQVVDGPSFTLVTANPKS
jgi:hypothetical protein